MLAVKLTGQVQMHTREEMLDIVVVDGVQGIIRNLATGETRRAPMQFFFVLVDMEMCIIFPLTRWV